jgi:hypothetical protein
MRLAAIFMTACTATQAPGTVEPSMSCPAPGTAPAFSGLMELVMVQGCYGYSASATTNTAMAMCLDADYQGVPSLGPLAGAFAPLTLATRSDTERVDAIALGPDGDEAIARLCTGDQCTLGKYVRDDVGWHWDDYLPVPGIAAYRFSIPTRKDIQRLVVVEDDMRLHELYEDGELGWREMGAYGFATVDLTAQEGWMSLSPDGLRLVFTAFGPNPHVYYADRASLDDPFAEPSVLAGVPAVLHGDAFMTADCQRIYYSRPEEILYIDRDALQ